MKILSCTDVAMNLLLLCTAEAEIIAIDTFVKPPNSAVIGVALIKVCCYAAECKYVVGFGLFRKMKIQDRLS